MTMELFWFLFGPSLELCWNIRQRHNGVHLLKKIHSQLAILFSWKFALCCGSFFLERASSSLKWTEPMSTLALLAHHSQKEVNGCKTGEYLWLQQLLFWAHRATTISDILNILYAWTLSSKSAPNITFLPLFCGIHCNWSHSRGCFFSSSV